MSEENVKRLRDAYEAWNRGDLSPVLETLHPEVEFSQPPGFPGMGVYRGREEVESAFKELTATFEDFKTEAEEIIDLEDGRLLAFVRLSGYGRGSGAPFEVKGAQLFTPAPDGRLLRLQAFFDRAEALEAAGLSE
jgi:ketosteroid isomerase-like protein